MGRCSAFGDAFGIASIAARPARPARPPLLVGLGVGIVAYYALAAIEYGDHLGPVIGPLTASAAMRTVLVDFSGLAMGEHLENWAMSS